MTDVPTQLVVAAFDDEDSAKDALTLLKDAKRVRLVGIEAAAVLRKDDKGKLHIRETADMGGGKGAAIGGVLGAGIGAIAGAALAVPILVGGLIGGLTAKLSDSGFDDHRLKRLGEGLPPGSSAIVALVEHTWVDEVRKEMAEVAADVVTEELAADIAAQLETHHETAYTALQADGSLSAGHVAVGDDDEEGGVLTIGGERIAGGSYLATDEGIVVAGGAAGPDGAVGGASAVTVEDDESDS